MNMPKIEHECVTTNLERIQEKKLFLCAVQMLLERKIQRPIFPAEVPALAFVIQRTWDDKCTPRKFFV